MSNTAPATRKRMTDAELIAALRRRPYDRAAREAADRLEELTRDRRGGASLGVTER